MSELITKRVGTTVHILWGGSPAGRVFKYSRCSGYGLLLDGVYWRSGTFSLRGGNSTKKFNLMRDAIAEAGEVLGLLAKMRIEP